MPTVALGVRQLFESPGIVTGRPGEFGRASQLPSGNVIEFYVGSEPTLGVPRHETPRYIVPNRRIAISLNFEHAVPDDDAPVLELLSYRAVHVPLGTWKRAMQGHDSAQNSVFAHVDKYEGQLGEGIDYLAGALGLVLHRQISLLPFGPDQFAVSLDEPSEVLRRNFTSSMEVLEVGGVNPRGAALARAVAAHASLVSSFEHWAAALFWLNRAWNETNTRVKFSALFVALEMILVDIRVPESTIERAARRAVRKVIRTGAPEHLGWFDASLGRRRPSLAERFEALAAGAALPGGKGDGEAVDAFNRMRNDMLHRGSRRVTTVTTISDGSKRDLEDIVERYLSWRLFGRPVIYQSRFRPSLRDAPPDEAQALSHA